MSEKLTIFPADFPGPPTFMDRLRHAAVDGVLGFVKWGIPVLLMLLAGTWLITDYSRVRVQASRGNAVFEMVVAQQQAAEKAKAAGQVIK